VATLGSGEFLGEIGLLEGPTQTASVVASTPMRLLVMAGREFITMMHALPAATARVEQALAERR
jgi:CRP-like cAMP-binding protein